jgi:hypothetical protein
MKISKKTFLSLIKENITEMAMDFDPNMPERPHTDVQQKLATGDTPIKKVPLPKTGREGDAPSHNYQELLASQRYKQVIEKLRGAGVEAPVTQISSMQDAMNSPIVSIMGNAHANIVNLESEHRIELAQLAVDLVTKVWQIPEGMCQWDVQIINQRQMDTNFPQDQPEEENPEEVEDTEEIINDLAKLNLERAKRRFINLIVQGASKRGHYMYQMVPDELERILPGQGNELMYNYAILMSTNDTLYWQMGEQMMGMQKGSVGGREEVDRQTDPPTIKVRAVNFPIAVHECIKGWLELVATKGEKAGNALDQERYMQAKSMEDTIDKELWDLRLGPAIWDKVLERIPVELVTDKNTYGYQNFLLMEIFSLPAKKMLVLLKEVVAQTPVGDRLLNELIDAIKENMNQYNQDMVSHEANEALGIFNDDLDEVADETDEDELKDILGSMGIGLSDDDEEDDLEDEEY